MTVSQPFVHLHVHSHFSFARGVDDPERLCRAACERGMDTLAVTDTNGVYGLVWFQLAARKYGIRPIHGAQLVGPDARAVVLARDTEGYRALCRALTERHRASGPTVGSEPPRRWDPAYSTVAALADLPASAALLIDNADLLEHLRRLRGAKGLFAEWHPGLNADTRIRFRRLLAEGVPSVASGAVHFVDRRDRSTQKMLRTIAGGRAWDPVGAGPPGTAPDANWLAPAEVVAARFPDFPGALRAAVELADSCRFELPLGQPIFPGYPVVDGRDAVAQLRRDCLEGVSRRYTGMTSAIRRRLDYELSIIGEKGFAPYFLVVRDIVRRAPRTCGRGSAAASLVSYLLGITQVDPIRHQLYFERFLNPGRVDPPDIDVDFPWDERDDVLDWTFRHFGLSGQAAMVANHNTLSTRSAIREVAKAFGLPDSEIGRVSKRMPWHADDLELTVREHPVFRGLELAEPWPKILAWARRLRGTPRHLSLHCGGVVLVPGGVDRVVPMQPTPKGLPVIQWEKDQAEEAGLVKIDLLGNRSLAVIRDACNERVKNGEEPIDFHRFDPTDDPETRELLRQGKTMGVFYVESPAMRQLQAKCGKGDFEHLVIHSSIIRPAANVYIQEYIQRLHGGNWEPLHPVLDHVLQETYGLMVYQEDVSKTAIALAGFDAVSADDLRKVLSKKHKAAKLEDYRERFFQGAARRGAGRETIEKIWQMILSFSGYSFCKPHSASYAMVSFRSAYLRAHHPAEFMAAVISHRGGYYSTFAYTSECRRMGLKLKPPCVQRSERSWTGRERQVRVGLEQLKGLPGSMLAAILEARRRGGTFRSFDDLMDRLGAEATPEALRILVLSGSCDALRTTGESRADLVWRSLERDASRHPRVVSRSLFAAAGDVAPARPAALPRLGDYDERTMLEQELETLGLLVSRHPLFMFRDRIRRSRAVAARDLSRHTGRRVRVVGWYVTAKQVRTKHDEPMQFLSFEDTTAIFETTLFPKTFRRYASRISRTRPYLLEGRVDENYGVCSLTLERVTAW
jgi:error-prone DNA polymerase